jgi:hypothetical protein
MPNQQLKQGLTSLQQAYDSGDVAGAGKQLTQLKVSLDDLGSKLRCVDLNRKLLADRPRKSRSLEPQRSARQGGPLNSPYVFAFFKRN